MTLGLTSNELALPFQMTPSYLLFLRSHVNTAGVEVPHMTLRCPKSHLKLLLTTDLFTFETRLDQPQPTFYLAHM